MINIFKTLNPINIIWLAIILFVLRAGYLFHVPAALQFEFTAIFDRLLLPVPRQYGFPSSLNILLAAIMVLAQALLVNQLVNNFNLLNKPTLLPALMYVALAGLFTPFLVLSPPLLCNFLVIWMLFKLFKFYKSGDAKAAMYDLGMIVALGSLIYLPFIYLFLIILIALLLFKPFNWREVAAGVVGYSTIFFFLGVYYYLNNNFGKFFTIWGSAGISFPDNLHISRYNYLVLIPVAIILLLCFSKLQQNFLRSYVQVRKSFQLLLLLFLMAGFTFFAKSVLNLNHFLLCAVPGTVFFSYYFLYAKRKWLYETLFILLLICIICLQFNTF